MPIYAYRCSSCGYAKDVLQKMSDPLLVTCPECGKDTFVKQVTAAGFQLKGSGWYVTDFRDNGNKSPSSSKATEPSSTPSADATTAAAAPESANSSSSSVAASPAAPATSTSAGASG